MSSLAITVPATLLLAGILLFLVVRAAQRGEFEDSEGPAERMLCDDDRCPEQSPDPDPPPASQRDGPPIC
jgi:cbb3-type cytochrome oxidase maturation protein